jgi:hypothetical protein
MEPEFLAELRAEATAELAVTNSTALVRSYPQIDTETGGQDQGDPEDAGPFPVQIQEDATPSEKSAGGGRVAGVVRLFALLPWNTPVMPTNELVVTDAEGNETTYQVVDTNVSLTTRLHLYATIVKTT